MQKSSFVTGLLNSDEKTIAEYLATWDDLNVLFKTLDTSWDFVSQLWKSDREIKRDNKIAFKTKVDEYLDDYTKSELHTLLFKNFQEIFDMDTTTISSQRELDDISCELEFEAIKIALDRNNWNMTTTSKELGISRMTLYRKLDQHNLQKNGK